jgi:hypothetical protein
MHPYSRRSGAITVLSLALMSANGTTAANAHGGGGHGGRGGGHAGGGFAGYHATFSRGYYSGSGGHGYDYANGSGDFVPPPFAGFPQDLPAARLHRFLAEHLPLWPWGNHRPD